MEGMSPSLGFTVYGLPAPQGSKRHVGNGVMVESSKHVRPWREDVRQAALAALAADPGWNRDTPVLLASVVFAFARPRKHYRTGKLADQLRADAPHLHATTPDLDKLLRSTFDALASAGVFRNDSRLASVVATKTYVGAGPAATGTLDRPGARITLTVAHTALNTWSNA